MFKLGQLDKVECLKIRLLCINVSNILKNVKKKIGQNMSNLLTVVIRKCHEIRWNKYFNILGKNIKKISTKYF